MSNSGLSITLTTAQATKLLREANARQSAADVALGLDVSPELLASASRLMSDERYSRSLARGIMVFASFPSDGKPLSVTDVADRLSMSLSMVHRYAVTFVEMGLLERDPVSRTYQRPVRTTSRGL
jgi:DNA-binding MarR family transcriptional regulator